MAGRTTVVYTRKPTSSNTL